MYEVIIDGVSDCNCYKRRGEALPQIFDSSYEAKSKAQELVLKMNDSFCGVHDFLLKIEDNKFIITAKRVI